MRPPWESLPGPVRAAVEECLGWRVVAAASQPGGFSPGVAVRVHGTDGRGAFVKVASAETNDETARMHRDEARWTALLPDDHPSPRLLGTVEVGPWVGLVLELVDGSAPELPRDLGACVAALDAQALVTAPAALPTVAESLGEALTGWRSRTDGLDDWEQRHLGGLVELEERWEAAATGDAWLHLDARTDNLLVRPDGSAVLVDWPSSAAGRPFVDAVGFVPATVRDLGVTGADVAPACEELLGRFAAPRDVAAEDVTAVVCAFAGYFRHRSLQPPPPGMPTVRGFQASQAVVARAWLAHRTGWR